MRFYLRRSKLFGKLNDVKAIKTSQRPISRMMIRKQANKAQQIHEEVKNYYFGNIKYIAIFSKILFLPPPAPPPPKKK